MLVFLACPKMLKLILKSEVKELHSRYEGVYERQYPINSLPNGYPQWFQCCNDNCNCPTRYKAGVLWHDKDKSWHVGGQGGR